MLNQSKGSAKTLDPIKQKCLRAQGFTNFSYPLERASRSIEGDNGNKRKINLRVSTVLYPYTFNLLYPILTVGRRASVSLSRPLTTISNRLCSIDLPFHYAGWYRSTEETEVIWRDLDEGDHSHVCPFGVACPNLSSPCFRINQSNTQRLSLGASKSFSGLNSYCRGKSILYYGHVTVCLDLIVMNTSPSTPIHLLHGILPTAFHCMLYDIAVRQRQISCRSSYISLANHRWSSVRFPLKVLRT